eukprot:TRINITY_DN6351_c0_g2_i1.p1 TRINITY_DN6351_c0_g2~~TRINITY_DN6351_c0_g2_i1.p1  ORF type:complete len:117 (+),score=30.13 TRINITY_DN6351_c0_g2_i1:3-353(+)
MPVAPQARLSDGCYDMVVVRNCRPLQLLSLFLLMGEGRHMGSPFMFYRKVRGLKLFPGGRNPDGALGGLVMADGEILARNAGVTVRDERKQQEDPMAYSSAFHIAVQKGLARVFTA